MTAQRRYENFFRGTGRDRDPQIAYDSLESQALNIVRESIVAHALSMRRTLSPADLDRMLSAAQSQLRGMSPEDLRGISPSSAVLKTITDASFAAAPVADPQTQAALIAATANDPAAGTEPGNTYAARMLRLDIERAQRAASSNRYEGMSGSDRLSQGDLQNMAAARSLARDLGMPWAANNPDLLRLGPSAIRTLHEAGVQRQTFERMTSERVGIRAETAVGMAAWAKRQNLTPAETNRIMNSTSDLHERLSAGRTPEEQRRVQRELDESLKRFTARPNTAGSRQALEDDRIRHARNEQEREQIRQNTRIYAEAERANARTAARLRESDIRTGVEERRTGNDRRIALDGLDDPAPATPVQRTEATTGEPPDPSKAAVTPPSAVQKTAVADDRKPQAKAPTTPRVG